MAGLFLTFLISTVLYELASSYVNALNDCDDDENQAKTSSATMLGLTTCSS